MREKVLWVTICLCEVTSLVPSERYDGDAALFFAGSPQSFQGDC